MILYNFEDDLDVEHILLGAPWSSDKYLIALCRYEFDKLGSTDATPKELHLHPMWHDVAMCEGHRCSHIGSASGHV